MRQPHELIQFYEVLASTVPQPPRADSSSSDEEFSDEQAPEQQGAVASVIACTSKAFEAVNEHQASNRKKRMAVREAKKPAPKKRNRGKTQTPADLPEPVCPLSQVADHIFPDDRGSTVGMLKVV